MTSLQAHSRTAACPLLAYFYLVTMATVIQMIIVFALETANKLSYAKRIQIHRFFPKM